MNLFKEITAVPRCFMYERNMGIWLQKWARENGYQAEGDSAGNLVVRVPATQGYEQAPVIVLQSHMDMVCEKSSAATHDFFKDPIRLKQEGEWLQADQTTLGADDGIGMALALAAKQEKLPKSRGIYALKVDVLQGGHSGVDIHLKRGNAIKPLAK